MRAICGLKEPATRERTRATLVLFLLRVADEDGGMKESSRSDVRYCVRFEEISVRVWNERKLSEHQLRTSPCRMLVKR